MNKEEAIKIIEYTFLNADGHLKPLDFDYGGGKGIVEALRMAIEALSQPSLPTNLDEAANEKVDELIADMKINGDMIYLPTARVLMIALARFGAEWMAGQGETIEGEVMKDINNNLCVTAKGFSGKEAKFGDKVVVQIRKK